jgi:3-deoxy-7-phosphoheptulonate synthase
LDLDNDKGIQQNFPFTSEQQNPTINECLLLSHEEAPTCEDFASIFFYEALHTCSRLVHTCQLDGTHNEFLCGVSNPLGIKVYHLFITKNSHGFIEPFFNFMKCSMGSM